MSLYPSLEDMKVDHMLKAQQQITNEIINAPGRYPTTVPQYGDQPSMANPQAYPALGDYMGLEFTHEVLALNMPEYLPQGMQVVASSPLGPGGVVAPLSVANAAVIAKATPTNAIRQIVLCKNDKGQVGLRVKDINKGIFVCLVKKDTPAALAGLRFGDQILEINDQVVAGLSMDKVHSIIKKSPVNGIRLSIRDRPFERCVTLHKDSLGHIGFQFHHGKVTNIVKESSAARNGLLTDHHLLEVNGQNVVGLNDKEVAAIIDDAGSVVTVTVMPSFVFKHVVSKMASSLTKIMDHSLPLL